MLPAPILRISVRRQVAAHYIQLSRSRDDMEPFSGYRLRRLRWSRRTGQLHQQSVDPPVLRMTNLQHRSPPMFEARETGFGLMKCAGDTNALHECQSSLSRFGDEKDRLIRPSGRASGRRPWVAVWFQECNVPVLFPSRYRLSPLFYEGGSNIYFSRPHKLLRRALFAGCQRGFRLMPCPDTMHDVPRLIR